MQSANQIKSSDQWSLQEEKALAGLLNDHQKLIFATPIFKNNRHGAKEERILVLTSHSLLNVLKSASILKVFIKKFVKVDDNYEIKRRVPLTSLYGITITPKRTENMFLLHVINDHDYFYEAISSKMPLLQAISEEYRKIAKKQLPFFFRDSMVLLNYCTFKNHLRDNKNNKPKQNPHFLNYQYFEDKEFEDAEYFTECLVETEQNLKVRPKDFVRVDMNKLRPLSSYYVLREEADRSVHLHTLPVHPNILKPQFTFFNEKQQLLFIPFMLGGNFKNYLSQVLPMQKQNALFYMTQIILLLQNLQKQGRMYTNLCLENIYVKENGYLVLDGLEKMEQIKKLDPNKPLKKIFGNPQYFAPEVINFEGYQQEIVIWKLGVISYYLWTGKFPFKGHNIKQLYYNILYTEPEDQQVPKLILRMLQKNKKKRITLDQIRSHPDLEGVNWQAYRQQKIKAPFVVHIQKWSGKVPIIYELSIDKSKSLETS